jgi:hypothetical protein
VEQQRLGPEARAALSEHVGRLIVAGVADAAVA